MVVFKKLGVNVKPLNCIKVVPFFFGIVGFASCLGWAQMNVIVLRHGLHSWTGGFECIFVFFVPHCEAASSLSYIRFVAIWAC